MYFVIFDVQKLVQFSLKYCSNSIQGFHLTNHGSVPSSLLNKTLNICVHKTEMLLHLFATTLIIVPKLIAKCTENV